MPGQTAGIAGAIEALMVCQGCFRRKPENGDPGTSQNLGAHEWMAFHDFALFIVEWAGFLEHVVRGADLADIVHGRRAPQHARKARRGAEQERQGFGQEPNPHNVHRGVVVAEFGRHAQVKQGLMVGSGDLAQCIVALAVHVPEVFNEAFHLRCGCFVKASCRGGRLPLREIMRGRHGAASSR